MIPSIGKNLKIASAAILVFAATQGFSFGLKNGHILIQGGGYFNTLGQTQHIHIDGLVGDRFNVTHRDGSNGLFGLGYLVDGPSSQPVSFGYGVNAFYLAHTGVKGTIDQELLFTNLAYRYSVTRAPIYATIKALTNFNASRFALTVDAGIGPSLNFMTYQDRSLDNGITLPDNAFIDSSSTSFSATAGVGLRVNNVIGTVPVEIGYRYFYFGKAQLQPRTDSILNPLRTGSGYAHAVVATLIL